MLKYSVKIHQIWDMFIPRALRIQDKSLYKQVALSILLWARNNTPISWVEHHSFQSLFWNAYIIETHVLINDFITDEVQSFENIWVYVCLSATIGLLHHPKT